jgi:hypothetical protein
MKQTAIRSFSKVESLHFYPFGAVILHTVHMVRIFISTSCWACVRYTGETKNQNQYAFRSALNHSVGKHFKCCNCIPERGFSALKLSFKERHFCTSRNRVRPSRCAKSLQPPFKTLSHTQESLALRRPTEQRNIASCSRVIETASSTVGINMDSQHYTSCSRRDAECMRGRTYSQSLGLCDGCLGSVGTTLKSSGYRLQDSSYCMTGFFFLGDVLSCSFYTFRHDVYYKLKGKK